jgi:hypothetical protein
VPALSQFLRCSSDRLLQVVERMITSLQPGAR